VDAQSFSLFLLKTTVLLLAGTAVAASLRRASAGTRHLVWLATLAGLLVLPALLRVTPLRLEVLPAPPERAALARPAEVVTSAAVPPVSVVERASDSASPAFGAPTSPATPRWLPAVPSLGQALIAVWLAVALVLAGSLALGLWTVRRIVRSARPLDDPAWSAVLCEVADRLGLADLPRLVASDRIEMPFACGLWRATVVLPASAEQWTDARRRLVLLHELAHVRRRDLLGHAAGRLACAAYWFHPLVWAAAKRLRIESERACDDLVLATGARASDYADHLLDIVAAVRRGGAPAPALPMARRREFEGRMLAILDPAVRRGTPGRVQSAAVLAGLAVTLVLVAASAPSAPAAGIATAITAEDAEDAEDGVSASVSLRPLRSLRSNLGDESAGTAPAREQAEPAPRPRPEPKPEPEPEPEEPAVMAYADDDGERPVIDAGRRATLIRVLRTDTEPAVRRSAAWALASVNAPDAAEALRTALRGDADAEVREMAAWGLGHSNGDGGHQAALAAAIREDKSDEVRKTAVWALAHGRRVDTAVLVGALSDSSSAVREVAIWAMGHQRLEQAPAPITAALRDADTQVRLVAAWTLGQIRDPATVPALRAAFKEEKDEEVRRALFRALLLLDHSTELIEQALASKDVELRTRAVQMLAGRRGLDIVWPWPRPEPRPFP
jgi:beta-lactamase regulating signal transducer with metallopeptidase domain